ncbi:MAG: type II toxin-antitoxin system HicB family antitoxin [Synergistaceae bacterium]|jgi:predicted HicB family RNase H-like nuclease|nr:type II toxin-antitoxin system HicB family antitoxin [Synergistaceae bacterium]
MNNKHRKTLEDIFTDPIRPDIKMTYKGYQGSFEYDPEADIFHGDVLNIADVVTFQGRSIDELKTALAESVDVYLEYCEKRGKLTKIKNEEMELEYEKERRLFS